MIGRWKIMTKGDLSITMESELKLPILSANCATLYETVHKDRQTCLVTVSCLASCGSASCAHRPSFGPRRRLHSVVHGYLELAAVPSVRFEGLPFCSGPMSCFKVQKPHKVRTNSDKRQRRKCKSAQRHKGSVAGSLNHQHKRDRATASMEFCTKAALRPNGRLGKPNTCPMQ